MYSLLYTIEGIYARVVLAQHVVVITISLAIASSSYTMPTFSISPMHLLALTLSLHNDMFKSSELSTSLFFCNSASFSALLHIRELEYIWSQGHFCIFDGLVLYCHSWPMMYPNAKGIQIPSSIFFLIFYILYEHIAQLYLYSTYWPCTIRSGWNKCSLT